MTKGKEQQMYLVQFTDKAHAETFTKIKTVKELEEKCIRFHDNMEEDLIGRLQVYEADGKTWKVEPKIKRIYKNVKKEKHSKIVREYKPKISPRSLKKDK